MATEPDGVQRRIEQQGIPFCRIRQKRIEKHKRNLLCFLLSAACAAKKTAPVGRFKENGARGARSFFDALSIISLKYYLADSMV